MMVKHGIVDTARTRTGLGWVLVVDDHPLFCDALELTLRSIGGYSDISVADRMEAALALVEAQGIPALAVLDLNLPDVTGLEGLTRLRKAAPDTPVIVVSSMADNAMITNVLRAGATGFVPKHAARAVFQAAIDAVGRGEIYHPPGFVETSAQPDGADAAHKLASLTQQQARILDLICDGKLNKQIAYDLGIAETTVKAHVTAIMRKLGVQSRTQAVLVAQDAKFTSILPSFER